VPHRLVGSLSYRVEYAKALATTFSLFYEGSHQGRFAYRYTSDFNNDGINADLIYIPKDASEITFTDIVSSGKVLFTAKEQSDAFFAYISQDDYLSDHQGEYAERFGALLPWRSQWDFRVLQDIFTNIGSRKNTLQVSLDILNFGNMLDKDWGTIQTTNLNNGSILVPSVKSDGTATFQLAQVSGKLPTTSFRNVIGTASTWNMQVGVRYIF
jgi:hypothetical protein